MLDENISLPTWLYFLLIAAATYAVVVSVLFPSVRWFIHRRLKRTVERLNDTLSIKIKPFQQTRRQELIDRLVFDPQVLEVLEHQSQQTGVPREALLLDVKRYAREIVPGFNAYVYFRLGYWLARRISRFFYRIRVSAVDQQVLQSLDDESTVVFIMNHRSNMDYVLICYLAAEQVTLSYAVGEWARVFPLESLIRAMGAFFVRRGSQNPLYRKVLGRYVDMATHSGVCQAVFPEGGLSRDGNMMEPKVGFLDYMLRNYDYQRDRNITFIPVGINYDRVIEDKDLLHWDDKSRRQSRWRSLLRAFKFIRVNLFSGSRSRWQRYGYAGVNFGIPFDMRAYCEQHEINFSSLSTRERIPAIRALADELMGRVRYVIPVLPVPVIASVLLAHGQTEMRSLDIIAACDRLVDEMIDAGAAITADQKPRSRTITSALDSLVHRHILLESHDVYQINPEFKPLLEYYANSIRHWH
ncbi:1-acyl-sn-glycerol-3-phosphate acyltransferase [Pseudohongiella spirulinae]|uniref:Glycerol-3-phosphate acyltransferase n=1 Tax=Pseudohongiella spirulinae TaxID=1249552 RepID=A0A0S2KFG5_9GAMM|nr:1-acyl-sn-glycerol-3-phosphate acyltransferase [Pseudohongiella spirulinae]ALO47057.1 Glycerol-3-phosphate O-acyltransferase [Pseudohongiella spirulinae]